MHSLMSNGKHSSGNFNFSRPTRPYIWTSSNWHNRTGSIEWTSAGAEYLGGRDVEGSRSRGEGIRAFLRCVHLEGSRSAGHRMVEMIEIFVLFGRRFAEL